MIKNYLKIAWRNITRNKVNSFINIAGLAIGMTCVILILLFVQDEKKFDRFLQDVDQLYQVNMEQTDNGVTSLFGNTAPAIGPAMVADFPEIESFNRIHRPGDKMVIYEQAGKAAKFFTEKRIMAVDSNFLQFFSYKLKKGDPITCLEKPNSVVITEDIAEKYFDAAEPMGKTLLLGNEKTPFVVTGVLENIPAQSSLQFDILQPIAVIRDVTRRSWNWWWLQVNTYVKLKKNVAGNEEALLNLDAKFPDMVKRRAFARNPTSFEEFTKKGSKATFHLQPFTSIHLYSNRMNTNARITNLSDVKYIRIFSLIALFIIILACVNFMNLSTAQAAKRAKEVGIRKVLGSEKWQLVKQFLVEAMLFSCLATVLSVVLVVLLLQPFNTITGKELCYDLLVNTRIWTIIALLFLFTGLLAGSYPAFYLTAFKPVIVLKGMKLFRGGMRNLFIRNGLVIFQFTISTALIVATIIVYKQLQYTRNKDLGYAKENVLIIANSERLGASEESFRQELARYPSIANAAITSGIPITANFGDVYVPLPGEAGEQLINEIGLPSYLVDYDFIPTLDIQIINGRAFSRNFSDSTSVILNETAVKQIGWKNPIGMTLEYPGNSQTFTVIGVAKDFNIGSLRTAVAPFALFHSNSKTYGLGHSFILVRLKPGNINSSLAQVEKGWMKFA